MTNEKITGDGRRGRAAFTLIELLVVIAIIAVLASLIIPLAGIATTKMRLSRAQAELNNLVTAIEGYKSEVGFYPPDNGSLKTINTNAYGDYRKALKMHPLFYELVGCVFSNRQFHVVGSAETITPSQLSDLFNVTGIQNSQRRKADIPFKGFQVKLSMHAALDTGSSGRSDVQILISPVPAPKSEMLPGKGGNQLSPWFYDATSTNRNNKASFDLWAEVVAGGKTNIVGNWKN